MQQPAPLNPFGYNYGGICNQDGSGTTVTHQWNFADNVKPNQYPQWDTNSSHYVTQGNNYGPGPGAASGGAQTRVGPPQQVPQPSQPTPTSTPPGIHGDMSKQQLPAQMTYTTRSMAPSFSTFPRTIQPTQSIRHSRQIYPMPIQQIIPAPGPGAIVQAVGGQNQPFLMYQTGRQGSPFPNPVYMQPQYYSSNHQQQYYQAPVLQHPQFTGLPSGGPSPQPSVPQTSVSMVRPSIAPTQPQIPPPKSEPRRQRTNAIPIVDPDTMKEVDVSSSSSNSSNNNNVTPTRSNESSARETPQPNGTGPVTGLVDNTVAAEFAAKVAACALDNQPPSAFEVNCDSSETVHKQQSNVVHSEKVMSTLSTNSEEFVPRSHKVTELPPPVEEVVPTVSADTDAPAIDPYVTLKMPAPSHSPLRTVKKKAGENEQQPPPLQQPTVQQPPTVVDTKDKKVIKKEEPVEVSQPPPKERREKPRSRSKEQSPAPSPVDTSAKSLPEEVVSLPHHNGEAEVIPTLAPVTSPAPVIVTDGNKPSRAKGKKSSNKMRKGVEKEGSDMDAFTTEPTIVTEEKERPLTPVSPILPTPPQKEAEPLVDKIKDDLEEKENKLVAEKNEENVKVSALNKEEEEETAAPVIEKSRPQLTLRHSYSKDQWSPLNPEGKRKYDRDFLYTLKTEPQSMLKPDGLPDVVAVVRDISNNNNMRNPNMMNYMSNRQDNVVIPAFLRSQSQRGGQMLPKRGSQQGNKNKSNPKVIHLSLSLNEDVKLKTTENAWKPNRLDADFNKTEEEKQTEELYKKVRGILNKLTPQKFETLMKKFMVLPINTEERLTGVINLIFDKAVDEPSFSKAYANMCKLCSKIEVNKSVEGSEEKDKVNFRKILITRCQNEFESNKSAELDYAKWQEGINNCTDPEKKKELQLQYEEKERQLRMKSVGNIRFIGELFKLGMLTHVIMYRCIEVLLNATDEESLECLCKLLTTIGKDLENTQPKGEKPPPSLTPYFLKMQELAQKKSGSKISSRVRFMLQDVIELRRNKWIPRREDNNPKTIEQINKEVERENLESSLASNQPQPRNNRTNDRQDERKRGNRGNNADGEGWNTVMNPRHYGSTRSSTAFESSKMSVKQDIMDVNNTSLGGRQTYCFNTMKVDSKPSTFNSYSALRGVEERKPPQSINSNRRVTPTPSIEKERQRMLQGTVENDGRSSRGSSAQRERPKAPSRDNSVPRQVLVEDKDSRQSNDDIKKAEEKLERQTNTLLVEYLSNLSTVDDTRQEVEQLYVGDKIEYFVEKALSTCLEMKAPAQRNIGLLIASSMDSDLFSAEVLTKQLGFLYENGDEIVIDIPKFWELQAEILVPILAAEKINFNHFKVACNSVLKTKAASKLLVPVLNLLVKEKGVGFARKVWDSSNVSLKDFLPGEVNVDDFIKENSLTYLIGNAPKYDANLTMDQVQEKVLRLLQNNQPYEKIHEFISSNVADKVEDILFIRALVIAICEACISAPKYTLDTGKFKQYEKLIQRFVDNKEDRELACLSSVHILLCRFQHPQGLIKQIFNLFLDHNLISAETFLKWKDDEHEKLENKGVSVMSLGSFFTALEQSVMGEADSDNENS